MKKLLIIWLSSLSLIAVAQQKKVAVYVTGPETVDETMRQIVGGELVSAIVANDEYNAVERTADFLKELSHEHDYQRSGSVDDQQIRELGRQFGVEQVCVASIMPYQDKFYIQARMLDVETATVLATAREISALATIEDMVSASEKVANKLVGKKKEEPKAYAKELSTVLLPSSEDCIICLIDNTESAAIASIKYIATTNTTIFISPETYIRDRDTDIRYKLTGTNRISTTAKTPVSQGITEFYLYFEKLPSSVQHIDIIEPVENGWRWQNITLRPYGKACYFVFNDNADERYKAYQKQLADQAAQQQRQNEEMQNSITQLGNAIANAVNPQYFLKITNNRAHTRIVFVDGQEVGEVPGLSVKTLIVPTKLYRKIELKQKHYLVSPSIERFTNNKQPVKGQTVEIVDNPL